MKIALATNNAHKLEEMRVILSDCFDEFASLKELGIDVDIEETGTTLVENALIKARTIHDMTGMISLADDTGLSVDALNGEPGVYSARYAGEEHDDNANIAKLLDKMNGVALPDRTAHFSTVIAVCFPDGTEFTVEGRVDGHISTERHGTNGFGYDPVFFANELNKCFAEGTIEEKSSVSHRSRALHKALTVLKEMKANGKIK